MKKLIILTIVGIIFYTLGYKQCLKKYDYKTQAEMISVSVKDAENYDTKFNEICNKILDHFKADSEFVNAFSEDKNEFLKYMKTHTNTMLPAFSNDPTAYGTNYPIYYVSIHNQIIANKIAEYKETIKTYCFYNNCYHPEGTCSDETIEKLFDY